MIPTKPWSNVLDAARQVDRLRQELSPLNPSKLRIGAQPFAPVDGQTLSPAARRAALERHLGVLKSMLTAAGLTEEIELDLEEVPKTLRQNLLALLRRARAAEPQPTFEATLRALVARRELGTLDPLEAQQTLGRAFLTELGDAPYEGRSAAGRLTALLEAMDPALRAALTRLDQPPSDPALAELARSLRAVIERRGNALMAYLALLEPTARAQLGPILRGCSEARNQAQCQMLEAGRFDAFERSRLALGGPAAFPEQHFLALRRFLEGLPERDTRGSSVAGALDALVFFRDTTAQPGWTHGYILGAAATKDAGPTQFQGVLGRLVDRWLEQGRRPELEALAAREGALLESEPFRGATYFRFAERLDVLEVLHAKGIVGQEEHAARLQRVVARRLPEARRDRWVNMWQGNILRIMERHPELDFSALPGVRKELLGAEDLQRVAQETARPSVADAASLLAERFPRPLPSWHVQSAVSELHAMLREPARAADPRVARLVALDYGARLACLDELRLRLRAAAGLDLR